MYFFFFFFLSLSSSSYPSFSFHFVWKSFIWFLKWEINILYILYSINMILLCIFPFLLHKVFCLKQFLNLQLFKSQISKFQIHGGSSFNKEPDWLGFLSEIQVTEENLHIFLCQLQKTAAISSSHVFYISKKLYIWIRTCRFGVRVPSICSHW